MIRPITSLLALAAIGCLGPANQNVSGAAEFETTRLEEGAASTLGVIAFLNAESTSFQLLDIDVTLDRRAAASLTEFRAGLDGVLGTADDRRFTTGLEVADCYFVGQSAERKLEAWAEDHGWITDDSLAGTWEGVTFTEDEAASTLELSNTAGINYLDHDLGLDARAADSIKAARPITSIDALAGLYYVGPSALNTLRDAAIGEPDCDAPGWDIEYVFADDSEGWRSDLPPGLAALVDSVLETQNWCGEAYLEPWFVKATIDRFNCEEKGYTIELGQLMDQYHGVSWYIEFEVDAEFDTNGAVCEV